MWCPDVDHSLNNSTILRPPQDIRCPQGSVSSAQSFHQCSIGVEIAGLVFYPEPDEVSSYDQVYDSSR